MTLAVNDSANGLESRGAAARRQRSRRGQAMAALPLLAYLAALVAWPTAVAIQMALTDPLTASFPSLANFRNLHGDTLFWQALGNNVALPAVAVSLEMALGLALALLFHENFPGRGLLRAVAVLPFALPEIVYLTTMRYVFAPRGYANAALVQAGSPTVEWLQPGTWTAFLTVAAVDAWHVTPVVFLVLAAALHALPATVFEAALLDGARGWKRFLHVTLPLLRPALLAALLLRGLDALRLFAAPLVLTGVEGVPVLSSYAYHQWSDYGDDGAAAAASVVLALLSVVAATPLLAGRRTQ